VSESSDSQSTSVSACADTLALFIDMVDGAPVAHCRRRQYQVSMIVCLPAALLWLTASFGWGLPFHL